MEIVSDVRFDGWAGGIDGWVKKRLAAVRRAAYFCSESIEVFGKSSI